MGFQANYGDATRLEILEAAGCKNAKLFVAAIDNPEVNLEVIEIVKSHFPKVKILARAKNRIDAYELIDHKVHKIYRETLYSAVNMGVDILVEMGFRKYTATRQGQQFLKNDEKTTYKLAKKRHNKKAYMTEAIAEIKLEEKIYKKELQSHVSANEHSWDSEYLKENMKE